MLSCASVRNIMLPALGPNADFSFRKAAIFCASGNAAVKLTENGVVRIMTQLRLKLA